MLLAASSVVGQGIGVAGALLLTRLYAPDDFGLLAIFAAVTSILGMFAVMRMDAAIPLPVGDRSGASLVWGGLLLAAAVAATSAAAIALASPWLDDLAGLRGLSSLWWVVGVTVWLIAATELMSAWSVRQAQFRALATRNLVMGSSTVLTQSVAGLAGAGHLGLVFGIPVGRAAAIPGFIRAGTFTRMGLPRLRLIRAALFRFRRFPLVSSWSALISSAGLQLPVLLISALYGQTTAGLLALTLRVMAAPVIVVGQAVARVYVSQGAGIVRTRQTELSQLLWRTVRKLFVLGSFSFGTVIVFGPELFAWLFGETWRSSGELARWLAVGYIAQLSVSPIGHTLLLLERAALQLAWDAVRLVIVFAAPVAAFLLGWSATAAVAALSGGYVLAYLALLTLCARQAARHDRESTRA